MSPLSNRPALTFLQGGGEMGERMRAMDWSATALGPVESWPQSLRSTVSMMLPSKAQIILFWGPEFVGLYNDAYRPVFGAKHPEALGLAGREAWREIWDGQLHGLLAGVVRTGEAFWAKDLLFELERHGFPEETYFDVSYDPVRVESGDVGGVYCIVTETTERVVGERRLALLKDLAARNATARTVAEACALATETLSTAYHDLPFAVAYLGDERQSSTPGAEEQLARWKPELVKELSIASSSPEARTARLLVGLNPKRPFDDQYRLFVDLVADQFGTALANARAHEQQRHRAEALAELDRAKTAFFSNVSHEFRTPLTLLVGPLEDGLADADTPLPPVHRDRQEVAHRNALRLLRLVNTLLDFSRIEAGRIDATFERTDLASFTAELASLFRSAIEKAGLELVVDCGPEPAIVHVDREMWEKIVLNLLSNAFKFTFEGRITVELRPQGESVELRVSDTGVGILQADLPRMFERFHRVRHTRARTHEGTGIGLALVQELARIHGGGVTVASEEGRGTTFTVQVRSGTAHLPPERIVAPRPLSSTGAGVLPYVEEALRWLPLPEVSAQDPTSFTETMDDPDRLSTAGARILVVDDNADMRDYLRRMLGQHYRVEVTGDGRAALDRVRQDAPDLVLADVMMPTLDGFGLVAGIRAHEHSRALPVILLSARAGQEARIEGLNAGADEYLVKPFSARELLACVASQLALARIRRETERLLERQASELREANRAKDDFLAMLGHELRNPLAPIMTALQVMRLQGGDAMDRERTVIERQVHHLTRLVDDLLDVSRIACGKVELQRERIELAEVVAKAIEVASPLFEQRKHALDVRVPRSGLAVDADPDRLRQIISNLLTNAAKYTESAGHIGVAASREGEEIVLRVTDNGIGIAQEMLPRVFDVFVQASQSIDRSRGGLGLGLTIVRNMVALHQGSVSVHSEGPGKGSEFVVRLPSAGPANQETCAAGQASTGIGPGASRANSLRVLVVDDNEDAADMLVLALRSQGHDARAAQDGPAALRLCQEFSPAVALLDIGLPVMDGYELAARLQAQPGMQDLRLVAVTGYGQDADRERSRRAGFHQHLVKPINLSALDAVLTG